MATQAEPKKRMAYTVETLPDYDGFSEYAHCRITIYEETSKWDGSKEWQWVGSFKWQADRHNDLGVQNRYGRWEESLAKFGGWYGGSHVETRGYDIEEAYEQMKTLHGLWSKSKPIIEKYNLGYKYDAVGAMIAAFNRMGLQPLRFDKLSKEYVHDSSLSYYK